MGNYFTSVSFWLQIVLMMVFFTVSGVMNIATINNYLLLYEKKRTNKIEVVRSLGARSCYILDVF